MNAIAKTVGIRSTRGTLRAWRFRSIGGGSRGRTFAARRCPNRAFLRCGAPTRYHEGCARSLAPSSPGFRFRLRHSSSSSSKPPEGGRDDASLARYPNLRTPGGWLRGADYAGTLTFVVTGTVAAAQSGLDAFGSVVVGIVTGVGGGTIRDAVFLNKRPFWTDEPEYLWMGLFAGLFTFFAWPSSVLKWQRQKQLQQQQQQQQPQARPNDGNETEVEEDSLREYDSIDACLDTLDAIGLSAFAIVGAQNGIRAGMPMVVSALCGMATATFGGMVRDILCGREVRIVHSTGEIYAPPALGGAVVYLGLHSLKASPAVRIGAAFCVCMGGRFVAVRDDVKLHTWDVSEDNLGVTVRGNPTTGSVATTAVRKRTTDRHRSD